MFYGYAGPDGQSNVSWWLIVLRVFRAALICHRTSGERLHVGGMRNWGGTCFNWFDFRSFPKDPPLAAAHGSASIHS